VNGQVLEQLSLLVCMMVEFDWVNETVGIECVGRARCSDSVYREMKREELRQSWYCGCGRK